MTAGITVRIETNKKAGCTIRYIFRTLFAYYNK